MKKLITFFTIALTMVCSLQAAQVGESAARQVADKFFTARASRSVARPGQSMLRLAYTAQQERFYVYDRGINSGFVVVAGDDRLPQVLGYGDSGDFSATALPPSVQYWMDEMSRQIEYLQTHGDVAAHRPVKREAAVGPLMTTRWDQSAPFNNYCPVIVDSTHAVTGCVATATAQIMNYYQWPPVGRGSHSYVCNLAQMTLVELSADFSKSIYRWDLMLDDYDDQSSAESCDAVARLMSDVGISMDMDYGSQSGAWEDDASAALHRHFSYNDKYYWLNRDFYDAAEWDQMLVDEIGAKRPVMYCGNTTDAGHAFVLDGFDVNGYFHVNWGWGGHFDGYFLVSVLAPGSGYNFKYSQRGLFCLVPDTQADAINDVLFIRGQFWQLPSSAPLGTRINLEMDNSAEGNVLDTAGYELWDGTKLYYNIVPIKLSLYDGHGVERKSELFSCVNYMDRRLKLVNQDLFFDLPLSLEDGEYRIKVSYSMDGGESYGHPVLDFSNKELYIKMFVQGNMAYFKDCFLYSTYVVKSFVVPREIKANNSINVGVELYYDAGWTDENRDGPTGNVYLSLLKDGHEVASGPMCEVTVPYNTRKTYEMQITAPSQPGLYHLVLNDESGNRMRDVTGWPGEGTVVTTPVYVLPDCAELVEDFETMTAGKSTSDKDVQGRFTTWSFIKSGVRAAGEGRCNGSNAVMMKKPSAIYTTQPLRHNFFMAQAIFFNPTTTTAKYTLDYSLDNGTTWEKASTINGLDAAEAPAKSQYCAIWMLDLAASQPALFRIAMIGGSTAATYLDDISLYYTDQTGDVNGDNVVNIADVNAAINMILNGSHDADGDVNGDGIVNIADVNAIINLILS